MSEPRTRTGSGGSSRTRLDEAVIRVVGGPDRGGQHAISDRPVVVGTAEGCDMRLHDDRVSRRHCEIVLCPHGFLVRDLDSRNGTFFEGGRVGEIAVEPGAILRLGDSHLSVGVADDPISVPASARRSYGALVGRSAPMRRVFTLLERAAKSDARVLLGGETGTGKELAARAIHDHGARHAGPFLVLDCGAVARELLASALFGHVRGAFTGADRDRAGLFEAADGGTVLLDEIGELPLELQPMLLRVCERGEVTPVGSTLTRRVDVRILSATHRVLAEEVAAGSFREDLYYRLQILSVTMPPLRGRADDIALLCTTILEELGMQHPGPIEGPGLGSLVSHSWPGNVRELRNVLERALARTEAAARFRDLVFDLAPAAVTPRPPIDDAPTAGDPNASFQERRQEAMARFERQYLTELLREHEGNVKRASRASGIERTQLKRLLRKHGLR